MGKQFFMGGTAASKSGDDPLIKNMLKNVPTQNAPLIGVEPTEVKIAKQEAAFKKAFDEFVKDNSYLSTYSPYELLGAKVLLRIFLYVPPQESGLLDTDGVAIEHSDNAGKMKVTSFAKVVKIGSDVTAPYNTIKEGDIVTLSDDITGSHLNPAWVDWMEARDERPKIKTPPPPQYVGNIATFREYVFMGNKLKMSHDKMDAFTFLVPQNKIVAIWKG